MSHDDQRPEPDERLADRVKRKAHEAAAPEEDHRGQERNAGVAIAVLAALVVLLLLATVSGAIGMFRP